MNKNDKKISYLEERINKLQNNLTLLKIIIGVIVVLVILNFIVKNPEIKTLIQNILYLGFAIGWPLIGTILCYNVAKEKYQEKKLWRHNSYVFYMVINWRWRFFCYNSSLWIFLLVKI